MLILNGWWEAGASLALLLRDQYYFLNRVARVTWVLSKTSFKQAALNAKTQQKTKEALS